jgi:hypothetical protein
VTHISLPSSLRVSAAAMLSVTGGWSCSDVIVVKDASLEESKARPRQCQAFRLAANHMHTGTLASSGLHHKPQSLHLAFARHGAMLRCFLHSFSCCSAPS